MENLCFGTVKIFRRFNVCLPPAEPLGGGGFRYSPYLRRQDSAGESDNTPGAVRDRKDYSIAKSIVQSALSAFCQSRVKNFFLRKSFSSQIIRCLAPCISREPHAERFYSLIIYAPLINILARGIGKARCVENRRCLQKFK